MARPRGIRKTHSRSSSSGFALVLHVPLNHTPFRSFPYSYNIITIRPKFTVPQIFQIRFSPECSQHNTDAGSHRLKRHIHKTHQLVFDKIGQARTGLPSQLVPRRPQSILAPVGTGWSLLAGVVRSEHDFQPSRAIIWACSDRKTRLSGTD